MITLHEYQAWRCEAQSPIIEASLLSALSSIGSSSSSSSTKTNGTRRNNDDDDDDDDEGDDSSPLPPRWLINPLEDRASSGTQRAAALMSSIQEAKPALVAMADAYERFISIAQEAASLSDHECPEREDGKVIVDAVLWRKLRSTAEKTIEAHRRCFVDDKPVDTEDPPSVYRPCTPAPPKPIHGMGSIIT